MRSLCGLRPWFAAEDRRRCSGSTGSGKCFHPLLRARGSKGAMRELKMKVKGAERVNAKFSPVSNVGCVRSVGRKQSLSDRPRRASLHGRRLEDRTSASSNGLCRVRYDGLWLRWDDPEYGHVIDSDAAKICNEVWANGDA